MSGFRAFIAKGNVIDLAVAVIIGGAFGKIVTSLVEDLIMPLIGAIFGGVDFSSHYIALKAIPDTYHGPMTYAGLKAAGLPVLGWGALLTALVGFLILAYIIYLMVQAAQRVMPAAEVVEATPEDVTLLREIRDELKRRP